MKIIKFRLSQFKNNMFWRSVVVLVSGTALAQLIGLFTTPIVSRLYDPNAFGEYAIIISTATIIISISTMGLNSAVMVPVSDEESKDIFMVAFFTMLFITTIIFVVMIIFSPLKHFFNSKIHYIIACILVYVIAVINNTKGLLNIYVNRKRLNKVLFYNSIISAFATLLITIPLGILEAGGVGLITASIIAGLVTIGQMLYHVNPFIKLPRLSTFIYVYKKYKDFILFQYPSNFIENFAIQLPTQIFSAKFGSAKMGSYSMNEKILGIPTRLIGTPINTIYFRTASEYYKKGKNLAEFTFSLVTKIMLVAFIPLVITVLWGEQIFIWFLGSNWGEAGRLSGFLIVQYIFMFCANCTSYCRVAIGKQKINLVASILRLLTISASILLGINMYGDLFSTILFLTVGSSLYLIIDMAINFYCMGKYRLKYITFAIAYIIVISFLWFISSLIK